MKHNMNMKHNIKQKNTNAHIKIHIQKAYKQLYKTHINSNIKQK